jgi:hypothetical protein
MVWAMIELAIEKVFLLSLFLALTAKALGQQSVVFEKSSKQLQKAKTILVCNSWRAAAKNIAEYLKEQGLEPKTAMRPQPERECAHASNGKMNLESEGKHGRWNYRYKSTSQQSLLLVPLTFVAAVAQMAKSLLLLGKNKSSAFQRLGQKESLVFLFGPDHQQWPSKALARFDYQRSNQWTELVCEPEIVPLGKNGQQKCLTSLGD